MITQDQWIEMVRELCAKNGITVSKHYVENYIRFSDTLPLDFLNYTFASQAAQVITEIERAAAKNEPKGHRYDT
jgi:hypothetical protein